MDPLPNLEDTEMLQEAAQAPCNARNTFSLSSAQAQYFKCIFFAVMSVIVRFVVLAQNVRNLWLGWNEWYYFVALACCIVIPRVLTTFLSIHIYMIDNKQSKSKNCRQLLWFVILCPLLYRYYKLLQYAVLLILAAKKNDIVIQERYYVYMNIEKSDIFFIGLFESLLEAAPQKVLQISNWLAGGDKITWDQLLTIAVFFGSLSWSVVSYHKHNRFMQTDKKKISVIGMVFQMMWYGCMYVSRISCIAIVASVLPVWIITACTLHVLLISFIIFFYERPSFCSNTAFHRIMFAVTVGIIYIFNYISVKEVETKNRYILYYILCGTENVACVLFLSFWINANEEFQRWWTPWTPFLILIFFIGLVFMLIYYKYFHPNVFIANWKFNLLVRNLCTNHN